jgi:hypothetical protein
MCAAYRDRSMPHTCARHPASEGARKTRIGEKKENDFGGGRGMKSARGRKTPPPGRRKELLDEIVSYTKGSSQTYRMSSSRAFV